MDHGEEGCHLFLMDNPPWLCCCGIRRPREQGLVYFKDVSPKRLTRAMLTVDIFAQLGWAQVFNARREGSLLVSHEDLLMDKPERGFGCRALIFIHQGQPHYTGTTHSKTLQIWHYGWDKGALLRGLDGISVLPAPDLPFPGWGCAWPCSSALFTWTMCPAGAGQAPSMTPQCNLDKQCPSFSDPSALLCSKIFSSLSNKKSCRKIS